jgi:uncharacterized protein (DUF2236 family)
MSWFVHEQSIVRKIWGKSDTILFIFAGAAAEFALNKSVDWLFFTGRLPADPLGRLFSTVSYARNIVFSSHDDALRVIDKIAAIHKGVEDQRGFNIPPEAYRDVLYMLIDYSIRSYELLNHELSAGEKQEVFSVFRKVGARMGIMSLPSSYGEWLVSREAHMQANLVYSDYTGRLFLEYRRHLKFLRNQVLLGSQGLIVPDRVRSLLRLKRSGFMQMLIRLYKLAIRLRLDWPVKRVILPPRYVKDVRAMEVYN